MGSRSHLARLVLAPVGAVTLAGVVPVAAGAAEPGAPVWVREQTISKRIDHPCAKVVADQGASGCFGILTETIGAHWVVPKPGALSRISNDAGACGSYNVWNQATWTDWAPPLPVYADQTWIGLYFGYDGCGNSWSNGGLTPGCQVGPSMPYMCDSNPSYGEWHDPGFNYDETAWLNQLIWSWQPWGWTQAWWDYDRAYCDGYGNCGVWGSN